MYLFGQKCFIVHHDTVVDDIDTEGPQHGFQHGAVHIPDLAGSGRYFGRNQLVTGGDYANCQFSADYVAGANIAGFEKVVDAMLAQGVC